MNVKISFTVGVDAAGKPHTLYLGTDGEAAKAAYTAAVNGGAPGIATVYLFIRPRQDRRHDVVKSEVRNPKAETVSDNAAPVVVTPPEPPVTEPPVTETVSAGEPEPITAVLAEVAVGAVQEPEAVEAATEAAVEAAPAEPIAETIAEAPVKKSPRRK